MTQTASHKTFSLVCQGELGNKMCLAPLCWASPRHKPYYRTKQLHLMTVRRLFLVQASEQAVVGIWRVTHRTFTSSTHKPDDYLNGLIKKRIKKTILT